MKKFSYLLAGPFLLTTRAAIADFTLVEDFNGYEKDLLDGQGDWVTGSDVFEVDAGPDDAANNVMSILDTAGAVDGFLDLETPLEDGTVGTLFFRFRADDELGHVNIGSLMPTQPLASGVISKHKFGTINREAWTSESAAVSTIWNHSWKSKNGLTCGWSSTITTTNFPGTFRAPNHFGNRLRSINGPDSFIFRNGTDDPLINFYVRAGANHITPMVSGRYLPRYFGREPRKPGER